MLVSLSWLLSPNTNSKLCLCLQELIIEVENGQLTFRSLNDPKSAFISVEFDNNYFDQFDTTPGAESFSCKVTIKVSTSRQFHYRAVR
jgi:hypothetical protein